MSTKALPSEEEILQGFSHWGNLKAECFVVDGKLFAKRNPWFKEHTYREFKNIKFVKANTTISVPEVHGIVESKDGKSSWLIMDYLPGEDLYKMWAHLKQDERDEITTILKGYFDQLHAIPPPDPPYFGSLDHEPLPPDRLCLPLRGKWGRPKEPPMLPDGSGPRPEHWFVHNGPFDSQEVYNRALYLRANEYDLCAYKIFDKLMETHWKGHRPAFSHGDIERSNIMVERLTVGKDITEDKHTGNKPARFKVTIIDWENAAWYPEYYDFCYKMTDERNGRNWRTILEKILTPYWEEATMFSYALKCLCEPQSMPRFVGDRPEPTPFNDPDYVDD